MLDHFLERALAKQDKNDTRQEMVSAFMQFPDEELHKIASGDVKLADYGGDDDLEKFEGTPLYDQALALEEEKLELDIQDQQQRLSDSEERKQKSLERDNIWDAKDAIRLKQRMLELQLRKSQLGGGGEEEEEGGELGLEPPAPAPEVPTAEEEVAPEKLGAVDYFYQQRQAALRVKGELMKAAAGMDPSQAHGLPEEELMERDEVVAPSNPAAVEAPSKHVAPKMASASKEVMVKASHDALEKCAAEKYDELTGYEGYAIYEMAKAAEARMETGVDFEDLEDFEKVAIMGALKAGLKGAGKFLGSSGRGVRRAYKGGGLKGATSMVGKRAQTGVKRVGKWAANNPKAALVAGGGAAAGAAGLGYAAG